jgi:hypothetical protein
MPHNRRARDDENDYPHDHRKERTSRREEVFYEDRRREILITRTRVELGRSSYAVAQISQSRIEEFVPDPVWAILAICFTGILITVSLAGAVILVVAGRGLVRVLSLGCLMIAGPAVFAFAGAIKLLYREDATYTVTFKTRGEEVEVIETGNRDEARAVDRAIKEAIKARG